jgi:hypothetical protein
MAMKTRVLLQTTIPFAEDDWHVGRFSRLAEALGSVEGVEVVARDRAPRGPADPLLIRLAESDFDQLWLMGVDGGDGLTVADCAGITEFSARGGGILSARDHQDCGASICSIGDIAAAHFFHSRNIDPDKSRRQRDDQATRTIDWPNYHSGSNGGYQPVRVEGPLHPLLRRSDGSPIERFPAHPHEGDVGVPPGRSDFRVIATGLSRATGRPFNLIVAKERAIAELSFHHFVDYNWDPRLGCPSFVEELPVNEVVDDPAGLDDVRTYIRNAVHWLGEGSS